jgi:two-component system, NarL family, response regulator NreC
MKPTTIALAEDHQLVREGLRAILSAEPDLTVIGETGNGLEAVQLAERFQPDVLVLDVMMPGLNGLAAVREVLRCSPQTRVVMLSMYANEAYVLEAFHSGASGYVLKDSTADDLVTAVRRAAAGERFLSPPLSQRGLEEYQRRIKDGCKDPYETLTAREREVFQLVSEGWTSAQIAQRLSIGLRTVETHRANLMKKLGLRTPSDLVRYAIGRGILPLDSGPSQPAPP